MLGPTTEPPPDLTVVTACEPLPQGGDARITGWLDRLPNARLVVIDVFARVRGATPKGTSAYADDYAAVSRIMRIADAYGVAVLLVITCASRAATTS